jgi:hypothetical protein
VEIVSPSTRHTDRFVKYEEYEAAGVPEYWLIDTDRQYAEFFQRDEAGLNRTAFSGSEGVYRSRILEGFWLEVGWLWTRPPLWEVLQAGGANPLRSCCAIASNRPPHALAATHKYSLPCRVLGYLIGQRQWLHPKRDDVVPPLPQNPLPHPRQTIDAISRLNQTTHLMTLDCAA